MSRKGFLGFDLDGVLYPWQRVVWDYFLPEKFKIKTYEQFWNQIHLDHEAEKFVKVIALDDSSYDIAVADKKVVQMVNRLAKDYDIEYVTQRPVKYNTLKWLKASGFPNPEEVFIFNDKVPFIRGRGYDYYIEDRVSLIENLKNHVNIICVSQPWNLTYKSDAIIRIDSILHLEGVLNESC